MAKRIIHPFLEVKNIMLINSFWYGQPMLLDYDSTTGTIVDNTGNNTLTSNNVSIVNVPPNTAYFNGIQTSGSKISGDKVIDLRGNMFFSCWVWVWDLTGVANNGKIFYDGKTVCSAWSTTSNNLTGKYTLSWDGVNFVNSTDGSVKVGQWQHLGILRRSNGTSVFYIDGIQNTVNNTTGTIVLGTTNFTIGNRPQADRTFKGYIAKIQLYPIEPSDPLTFDVNLYNSQKSIFDL
jgi:hypothetical protein